MHALFALYLLTHSFIATWCSYGNVRDAVTINVTNSVRALAEAVVGSERAGCKTSNAIGNLLNLFGTTQFVKKNDENCTVRGLLSFVVSFGVAIVVAVCSDYDVVNAVSVKVWNSEKDQKR